MVEPIELKPDVHTAEDDDYEERFSNVLHDLRMIEMLIDASRYYFHNDKQIDDVRYFVERLAKRAHDDLNTIMEETYEYNREQGQQRKALREELEEARKAVA